MYICLCRGVSQSKLETILKNGAKNLEDVQKRCQAGKDCGSCLEQLVEIIGGQQKAANK